MSDTPRRVIGGVYGHRRWHDERGTCEQKGCKAMTTEANDTPTNATEGRVCAHVTYHSLLDGTGCTCTALYAEITELRAQLNRVIESSSIAESGRLNAEAENVRLREALESAGRAAHADYCGLAHRGLCLEIRDALAQSILKGDA